MTNVRAFVLFSFSLAVIFSCTSTMQTFSDRDTKVDLKNYKSYAWLAPDDTILNAKRPDLKYGDYIMYASNGELKKKGMVIDTLSPDAIFMFNTVVEEKEKLSQSPTVSVGMGFGGPGYYVGGSVPVAGGEITSTAYTEGTLVFNMFDARTGKLIWEGGCATALTSTINLESTIKTAVHSIFLRLPVKHKNKTK